ncbi:hypothetical protein N7471_008366 [Penicillium samsonianum]|uniref:uncharacterized protein n=1 Tax=Penicillium samsonianum TaxID=1882272 RepID=UPI0025483F6F|nr:uncharacterized protein N7471_008366 [Penicillium samsonianum]KAJ6133151.1 hypothetical protein N7471_008366 [Penicillium samsonianum]
MACESRYKSNQLAKWPTLNEVLSNTTPPPYTLSAFMTYLSENHCRETLQFIMAAKHYCDTYNSFVDEAGESIITADSSAAMHLRILYQLLLTTYIMPGAPREVNLSVNVRSSLLQHKDVSTPPLPEALDPGIKSIRDLMENSIFLLFLHSRAAFSDSDSTSEASNMDKVRPHYATTSSDNQFTQPARLHAKRPFHMVRTWSWPPWNRQPR